MKQKDTTYCSSPLNLVDTENERETVNHQSQDLSAVGLALDKLSFGKC